MALLTPEDIVNAALAEIGEEPIESLSDDLTNGQAASLIYETVVDFNLSIEPFSFAHEIRQLSEVSGAKSYSGFAHVFDVPGPAIGLPRWLTDDPTNPARRYTRFCLINGKVHADDSPLFAYVKFRADPWMWTGTFRKATTSALAAHLAMALASDRNTHDVYYQRAYGVPSITPRGGEMQAAIQENAQATPPRAAAVFNNPFERSWRS